MCLLPLVWDDNPGVYDAGYLLDPVTQTEGGAVPELQGLSGGNTLDMGRFHAGNMGRQSTNIGGSDIGQCIEG